MTLSLTIIEFLRETTLFISVQAIIKEAAAMQATKLFMKSDKSDTNVIILHVPNP